MRCSISNLDVIIFVRVLNFDVHLLFDDMGLFDNLVGVLGEDWVREDLLGAGWSTELVVLVKGQTRGLLDFAWLRQLEEVHLLHKVGVILVDTTVLAAKSLEL